MKPKRFFHFIFSLNLYISYNPRKKLLAYKMSGQQNPSVMDINLGQNFSLCGLFQERKNVDL